MSAVGTGQDGRAAVVEKGRCGGGGRGAGRIAPLVLVLGLLAGCAGATGGRAFVVGAGADDFLRLRAGPGLGYRVILGLPDGTEVTRRQCVTEVGQLWCRVALGDAPGISGYVSADYLSGR